MLAVVFGASGSGKSTQAALLRRLLPDVAVHDWDEIGGTPPWDRAWVRRRTRDWLDRAREEAEKGRDFLLFSGAVPGELLAAPTILDLESLAFCLLDCGDMERARRLAEREATPERPLTGHQLWDHVAWGVWLRFHATNPRWWAGPIRGGADEDGFAWSRWESWAQDDPRWHVDRIDTTGRPPEATARSVASWLRARQAERVEGTLPLSARWWGD